MTENKPPDRSEFIDLAQSRQLELLVLIKKDVDRANKTLKITSVITAINMMLITGICFYTYIDNKQEIMNRKHQNERIETAINVSKSTKETVELNQGLMKYSKKGIDKLNKKN
jgi:hypothetical protein